MAIYYHIVFEKAFGSSVSDDVVTLRKVLMIRINGGFGEVRVVHLDSPEITTDLEGLPLWVKQSYRGTESPVPTSSLRGILSQHAHDLIVDGWRLNQRKSDRMRPDLLELLSPGSLPIDPPAVRRERSIAEYVEV